MTGKIFVLHEGEKLTALTQTKYENEDIFQVLVEKYPEILAGDQINPDNPRQWILISREMGVPAEQGGSSQWYLDHLFIDQDGIPTLVEVKRSTDTRIRREVVAQMLDYAANAVQYWPVESIRELYELQLAKGTSISLEDIGVSPDDEDVYWQTVHTNLRAGKIRLLFVADEIPLTLQRIIEFLNNQMVDTEVLGIEIRSYRSNDGLATLVPSVIGKTASAVQTKQQKSSSRDWDEESFLEDVGRVSGERAVEISKRLLRASEALGCEIWWGHGKTHGSFMPLFYIGKNWYQFFSVFPWQKRTAVEVQFQYLKPPLDTPEYRQKLKEKLEKIKGVHIPADRLTARPNFDIELLENPSSLDAFMEIFRNYMEGIKAYMENSPASEKE